MLKGARGQSAWRKVKNAVQDLQSHGVMLLHMDKTGTSICLDSVSSEARGNVSILKNFIKVICPWPAATENAVCKRYSEWGMTGLCKALERSSSKWLEVFFTVEMHEEGNPSRAIFSESSL